MQKPKGGRPANNTKENLKKKLLGYTKEHPNQVVRLGDLERATEIKRHIWYYNMKDEIDEINKEVQKVNAAKVGMEIPSAEQIIASCRGNEKKLLEQVRNLTDLACDLNKYQDTAKAMETIHNDYENKLKEKDCIIKEQSKRIDELFDQINTLIIDSENPNTRKEKGIKGNFIELTSENMETFMNMAEKLLL